jgi:hypothetical protein
VAYFNVPFRHWHGCAEDNYVNRSLSTGLHWNQGPSALKAWQTFNRDVRDDDDDDDKY